MLSALDPLAFVAILGGFGLLVGSFLNVVVHRLPIMMEREWRGECAALLGGEPPPAERFNLATPRSRCPRCGHLIGALENIPLLSYAVQGGRCRHCGGGISARYPVVEALAGLVGAASAWHFAAAAGVLTPADLLHTLACAGCVWTLLALALIDYDTQLLPDSLTQPLLWFGLAASLLGVRPVPLGDAVIGAMAGYLALWGIYWAFKLATGKEGMGYGDFKLLAALGAWLGWQALPSVILLSSAVGAVIGLGLMATGLVKRSQPIPFGPYLALAGIIALFWEVPLEALFGGGNAL